MELALKFPLSPEARVRLIDATHRRAGDRMIRRGFGNATHVLSMFGEGRRYLLEARARGLTVVTDVNIAISAEKIVAEEQHLNSDWEMPKLYWGQTLKGRDDKASRTEEMLVASNLFLCPSEFVKEDLEKNYGISSDRTILLPYAVNPRWFTVSNKPTIGRVLFAGAAELRKGIHILADASDILAQRGRKCEFIVAGAASSMVTSHPRARSLRFLGRISVPELRTQFESADIFAFPSLAEGSAGVTYEAMACGLPIVTTRAAGSIARDGIEGRIVSERNSLELADAIEEIVFDRGSRERMSIAARDRAVAYSWEKYQRSLYNALLFGPTSRSALG
jgi:glycosyltransferase involved in cell wall biosynthesis